MDRRGFLKGAFGGVAAGGIVIAAAGADIEAFVSKVKKGDAVGAAATTNSGSCTLPSAGEFVFNHNGLPIGIVEGYTSSSCIIDASSFGDTHSQLISGIGTVKMSVMVAGGTTIKLVDEHGR